MTIQKTLAAACAVTLLASGCATQNGTGGISSESVLRCTRSAPAARWSVR